jgi:hypothetical protein
MGMDVGFGVRGRAVGAWVDFELGWSACCVLVLYV